MKPFQKKTLVFIYIASLFVVILLVALMYWPLGPGVVLKIVAYVAALAVVKLAVKAVYVNHHFRFPKFLTCMHMLASSLAGFLVLYLRRGEGERIAVPTLRELAFWISPISFAFAFSIVTENSALVFVSSAFSEVVGSCNPVVSAMLTPVLGMTFHPQLLVPIAIVVAGCIVSASGELNFSVIGFVLLLVAVFCRSIKAVTQQKLMTSETKAKFDPAALMAWTCCVSFFLLLVHSLTIEGVKPWKAFWQYAHRMQLFIAILNSCVVAVAVNISGLFCIKHLGAVGMQLVSQTKSVLVIVGGVAFLSESFTCREIFGFGAVLVGVFMYSRYKTHLDAESEKSGASEKLQAANFASEAGSDRTDDSGPISKLVEDITAVIGPHKNK